MARGSKAKYTDKQKRMASHIEDSEKKPAAQANLINHNLWPM